MAETDGLLVIDKPPRMTSRDAVDRVQAWFPPGTKLGHAGTLDPLATGVLVLCVGKGTRLIEYVQRMEKVYRAGVLLGARSDTDDADGKVTLGEGVNAPAEAAVKKLLEGFVGEIDQVPPAYSAAKITGRRAYDLARRGQEVSLGPRKVNIYQISLLSYRYPHLELEVRCGKGTYIRSLARDLGEKLGCGGLIESLRRTRIGPFQEQDALSLDADESCARSSVLPLAVAVADLPRLQLPGEMLQRLCLGQRVVWTTVPQAGEAAVFDDVGNLRAVVLRQPGEDILKPVKVFEPPK